MAYRWIIDKDHIDSGVGTRGPRGINPALDTSLDNGEGKHFRMYDDDGELYYEGRLVITEDEQDSEVEFRPLNDFGMPNAGATEIHYRDGSGNWKRV